MPAKHQLYQEWNADRFTSWAKHIGEYTELVVKTILTSGKVEQQGYRSCMALLKATDKYSAQRLESACQRALSFTLSPSCKNVLAILKSGSDKMGPKDQEETHMESSEYAISRGSEYYGRMDK